MGERQFPKCGLYLRARGRSILPLPDFYLTVTTIDLCQPSKHHRRARIGDAERNHYSRKLLRTGNTRYSGNGRP